MTDLLKNPIFNDETKAREWLEARVWADGRVCPHCGNADQDKITKLEGKAHRPGVYQCNDLMPPAIHRDREDGFRALQNPADQVACRVVPDDRSKRASAPSGAPHARHQLQIDLVSDASPA